MKNNKWNQYLKKCGAPILIIIVTFLAVKFFMWNGWMIDRAMRMVRGTLAAPSAVNLTLSRDKETLFYVAFPFNSEGNYYLVNRFDISPFINKSENACTLDLTVTVNKRILKPDAVNSFKGYHIVSIGEMNVVFTTAECDIYCLVRLRENLPDIIAELKRNLQNTKINDPNNTGTGKKL